MLNQARFGRGRFKTGRIKETCRSLSIDDDSGVIGREERERGREGERERERERDRERERERKAGGERGLGGRKTEERHIN